MKKIKDIEVCRNFYLNNSKATVQIFYESSVNLFYTLKEIKDCCSKGIKILEFFEEKNKNVFQNKVFLKNKLIKLREEITEDNYFTRDTVKYFEEDHKDRSLNQLNVKYGSLKALLKRPPDTGFL